MANSKQSEIILIAAMSENRVIGKDNTIPWHIPEELQRFKKTTWGYPLIMGRKTHLSIAKPLPGRMNIIVTRNKDFVAAGCEVAASLELAVKLANGFDKIFIIGGEQIFIHSLVFADTILLTVLPWDVDGDTFFPEIPDAFMLDGIENCSTGVLSYMVQTYRRKKDNKL